VWHSTWHSTAVSARPPPLPPPPLLLTLCTQNLHEEKVGGRRRRSRKMFLPRRHFLESIFLFAIYFLVRSTATTPGNKQTRLSTLMVVASRGSYGHYTGHFFRDFSERQKMNLPASSWPILTFPRWHWHWHDSCRYERPATFSVVVDDATWRRSSRRRRKSAAGGDFFVEV
jgi:hypothetical protein